VKESRALPFKPRSCAHASQRDVLTWESSGPNLGKRYGVWGEFFDVFIAVQVRPFVSQDAPAEFVDFALESDFETLALQSEIEPSDPREQGGGAELSLLLRRSGGISFGLEH
jgi:hypothetical protein